MLNREEHLYYCSKCKNQKFSVKDGLICKLTGKVADFDPVCPNFKSQTGEYGSDSQSTDFIPVDFLLASKKIRFTNLILDTLIIWFSFGLCLP